MTAFDRHRDEIASLLDERFWPMWWVEQSIASGQIALLDNDTAIVGIERREYPGGAVEVHGMFAAGALPGILELIDLVIESARAAGCDVAAIESRPAWQRLLKARGFACDRVRIVKEL